MLYHSKRMRRSKHDERRKLPVLILWQQLINRPIPDISITKMPKPHLSFGTDGAARAADAPLIIAGPSRSRASKETVIPELDTRPYERTMSKREKAAVCAIYSECAVLICSNPERRLFRNYGRLFLLPKPISCLR
jgi:hypothetical protein